MKVLTIIVNYRTPDLTVKAVRGAVRANEAAGAAPRIVVVDNHSCDDSVQQIKNAVSREGWNGKVEVVSSRHNGGFGYGNNLALRPALESNDPPDYVYLLNPDAIPESSALRHLIEDLDIHPRAAIAGSFIHGVDGRPHETAFRFPSIASEFEGAMQLGIVSRLLSRYRVPLPIPQSACEVDWTAAVSMLIRTSALKAVGLFDEDFFLYFEETDLCRRVRNAGWSVRYVPESRVAHVGSATTGLQDRKRRVPRYWFNSRAKFLSKHYGDRYRIAADIVQLLGGGILRLRRSLLGSRHRLPAHFMRDFLFHSLRMRRQD